MNITLFKSVRVNCYEMKKRNKYCQIINNKKKNKQELSKIILRIINFKIKAFSFIEVQLVKLAFTLQILHIPFTFVFLFKLVNMKLNNEYITNNFSNIY